MFLAPRPTSWFRPRLTISATAMAFACALALAPAQRAYASPPPWTNDPFSYYADKGAPLPNVLREFAASFSLALDISPQVTGRVTGRFQAGSPTEFLNQLGGVYGFQWFTHAGTLFVSRGSEMTSASISASGASIGTMRQALTSLGILDQRFGWGELPEQGLALVSGPPAYVALVKRTVAELPLVSGGQQVAVFRLKHASVDDRTITYRDRQITTMGLAQMLRNLISGGSAEVPGVSGDTLSRLVAPLRASGTPQSAPLPATQSRLPQAPALSGGAMAGTEQAENQAAREEPQAGSPRRRSPSIQADSRINALVIQDTPDRLPMYKALIDQLDIPTALIEIEALIIDVNSSRLDELGIAWGGRKGGTAAGFGDVSASADSISIGAARAGSGISTSTTVLNAANYLVARIRALENLGEASIQSRPSILTMDNTGALLDLSETFYVRTSGERVASVTPVTTAVTLKVTPRLIERGEIGPTVRLDVDIEDGKIQEEMIDSIPLVKRTTISTQALVGENQTLLIGGYNTQHLIQKNKRVPVLGEIPLLGTLFSHKVEDYQARERLFLIKPRVVTLPRPEATSQAGDAVPRIVAPAGRIPSDAASDAGSPVQATTPPDIPAPVVNPPATPFKLMKPVSRFKPVQPSSFPASGEFHDSAPW